MNEIFFYAFGAFLVAAFATHLMVAPVTRLAVGLRALDHPGERKQQTGAVPRLGGVAIALGLALGGGGAAVSLWGRIGTTIGREELMALVFGTGVVFFIGAVDDLVGVSAARKFLFQLVAAFPLVHVGWSFEVLRLPLVGQVDLGLLSEPVSLLWIVGVTNAINLIDGLDGLAGGVVTIIAASFLGYATLQGNAGTVLLMAAIAGACVGFLRHNWEPARIFMGDSGSLMLGFLLAATTVHSSLKAPAAVAILVPVLALGVPVMDTLLVMSVRFLDRPKSALADRFLRMFHADRRHLHHLLAHFGGKRSRIVAVIYAVVLSFCALALVVAFTGQGALGLWLVGLEFLIVLGMRQMGMAMGARRLSRLQREEIKTEVLALAPDPQVASVRRIVR
jgi:UDP-GlcNAc:undecaprenyl-phosphate/decaprenyl-phosphate GlcNAc-1-phosphate transferase